MAQPLYDSDPQWVQQIYDPHTVEVHPSQQVTGLGEHWPGLQKLVGK